MKELKELERMIICIRCPVGCSITMKKTDDSFTIENHQCEKGKEYATMEITNPTRHITSTTAIDGDPSNRLSLRTDIPVPKNKVFEIIKEMKSLQMTGPIAVGEIIIHHVAGTEADVIASSIILS